MHGRARWTMACGRCNRSIEDVKVPGDNVYTIDNDGFLY